MSLYDQMAADLAVITSDTTAFAEAVTYAPQGTVTTFAWSGVMGDPAPSLDGGAGLVNADQRVAFVGTRSSLVTGLTTAVPARSPAQPAVGDLVTFASGPNAGPWRVEGWHADVGDGVTVQLRRQVPGWAGRGVAGVR